MIIFGSREQVPPVRQRRAAAAMASTQFDLGRIDPVPSRHAQRRNAALGQQSIKITGAPVSHDSAVTDIGQ